MLPIYPHMLMNLFGNAMDVLNNFHNVESQHVNNFHLMYLHVTKKLP